MHPIEIVKIKSAAGGYKVLPSWRKPDGKLLKKKVDLWIPELAPRIRLMHEYRHGTIGWDELSSRYQTDLHSPVAREYLKPLALLSLRRKLILLCDCAEDLACPNLILCVELEECRRRGDFVLSRI